MLKSDVDSQLTHSVFKTLLESCAELVSDKRCSNPVATFDQIYFMWQWRWVISNVATTLQQRYLTTYNVAATLFANISPTFAQSCHSTVWQRSRNFPGHNFHNFHSMLWKRCYNLKLSATVQITFIFIDFRVCDFAFAFRVLNAFYFQTDFNLRFKRKRDVRLTCKRVWCILHRTLSIQWLCPVTSHIIAQMDLTSGFGNISFEWN